MVGSSIRHRGFWLGRSAANLCRSSLGGPVTPTTVLGLLLASTIEVATAFGSLVTQGRFAQDFLAARRF